MDPKTKQPQNEVSSRERDSRARNYVALANTFQSATVIVGGSKITGVRVVPLKNEELEKVHGSENEATG